MKDVGCLCGAVGRQVLPGRAHGGQRERPRTVWRGGRIEFGRVIIEAAREGETACPACRHRACVVLLVRPGEEPWVA
jgi:hypothetical protein